MRPHEDDEPETHQRAQPGGRRSRQPNSPTERQPRGQQQPPRRGPQGPQGAPPGGGSTQPPQQGAPPGQSPPQQGPPQQWHEPPSPPSTAPGSPQSAQAGGRRQRSQGETHGRPGGRQAGGQPQARQQPPGAAPQRRIGLEPVSVDDIVATDVVTAEADTSIAEVAGKMAAEDVGCVVVVDDDHSPVGVLTDRTIALSLESTPDATDREAGDLVEGDLFTGAVDMSVFDALQQLRENGVRRLPIVDEEETLEGIVTLDDILVLLGTELGNAIDVIKQQSPRI